MTRKAWQFFLTNAGYCTPPGRVVCAKHLAVAEERAKQAGLTFEWEWDDCPDLSWMTEQERQKEHEVLCCIVRSEQGEILASLSGIMDADRNYRRIVEAELASEALASTAFPGGPC